MRHDSFLVPEFVALLREFNVAVVFSEHETFPAIADITGDFVYLRLQKGKDTIKTGYPPKELDAWAKRLQTLRRRHACRRTCRRSIRRTPPKAKPRDVFAYVIHEGKVRAPAAAMELIERLRVGDRNPGDSPRIDKPARPRETCPQGAGPSPAEPPCRKPALRRQNGENQCSFAFPSCLLALGASGAAAQQLAPSPTLDAIKARGHLECGVHLGLPGFSFANDKGEWSGIDVDCAGRSPPPCSATPPR